jgi:glycosyltransferase involved in cell wall biosynthesis
MKILLVTEKCSPHETQRDGGARLVDTLRQAFGDVLSIMQFGPQTDTTATWHFGYPSDLANRFERRIINADFIAKQVKAVEKNFTHIIFVHVSMQFGIVNLPLSEKTQVWTFPMFLSTSYIVSGENVPENYQLIERLTLSKSSNIITPSHLEKRQLIDFYSVPEELIYVIPRGIDRKLLLPKTRYLKNFPKFCSVGSIKPQKNTLELIRLFAKINARFPNATLKIIGPIQDAKYYADVCLEIQLQKLGKFIEFTGHISPNKLALSISDSHIHISTSTCETFGRSIFETLASGLPNIARAKNNAAAEFLKHLPYAQFVDDDEQSVNIIDEMLANLSDLSNMALEVGKLYDDEFLSKLLIAKISDTQCIGVSDFDGTLFHKNDDVATIHWINVFKKFPLKVICSARPVNNLLEKLKAYNLKADWIIGYSGSIVTNGTGEIIWQTPIDKKQLINLESLIPQAKRIEFDGQVLQLTAPAESLPKLFGVRIEVYQDIDFISHWEASKLRAIHRLIDYISWSGQVQAFGDGPYDLEFLTYFDGKIITSTTHIDNP